MGLQEIERFGSCGVPQGLAGTTRRVDASPAGPKLDLLGDPPGRGGFAGVGGSGECHGSVKLAPLRRLLRRIRSSCSRQRTILSSWHRMSNPGRPGRLVTHKSFEQDADSVGLRGTAADHGYGSHIRQYTQASANLRSAIYPKPQRRTACEVRPAQLLHLRRRQAAHSAAGSPPRPRTSHQDLDIFSGIWQRKQSACQTLPIIPPVAVR